MKRMSKVVGTVLAVLLAGPSIVAAQERDATGPRTDVADAGKGAGCEGGPLAVVAQFLALAPEQVQAVAQLLQQREQALAPIQQQIAARDQQIGDVDDHRRARSTTSGRALPLLASNAGSIHPILPSPRR